ncbi:MFS transporter [Fictibacillus enclensis]|uniref:MFS transporter n=1 Tax=Fictibacillus enclensis TaxID=1017270 RepID=UPI0025A30880|nr:MFS transporter [Fictibacillus enclensis]MDM5339855.1 MFS transporter [Fictibacillus enclensis]
MNTHQEKLWSKEFILITLCNLLLFLNLQMLLPSFPVYTKDAFNASDFTVSLVTSLFALSAIATRFFAAGILRKGKVSIILYTGAAIAVLATAGYYWCGSIALLLVMRVLFGIGFGLASTTLPTMAAHVIPPHRMGEGIGYFGLSTSLAMSIGPIIGLSLLGCFGFGTLTSAGTLVLILIFPLAFANRSVDLSQAGSAASTSSSKKNTGAALKKIALPGLLNLLLSVTYGGLLSFLALYGKEAHLSHIGSFFLFNALAIFLVRPFSGRIFDSKGHFGIMIAGAVFTMGGLVTLSLATSTLYIILAALLYGLGYGMIQPSIQAWMIKEVPVEQRGLANSMFFNSLDFGVAAGSMLLGVMAMHADYSGMYRISALFMGLFLVLYLVVSIWQRKKRSSQSEQRTA